MNGKNYCVIECNSNYYRAELVAVFKFPKNDDLKDSWIWQAT